MEHILLIEDNLADIALIQSYLRDTSATHRLHKARSLHDGLAIIQHNLINIILLDLTVDDSAGFNTLRMLLNEVPDIPVIVLTGTSNEVLGMQIVRAGAQDYLVKGYFDSKQLSRAIRHSIKRFKAQVELRKELWETRRLNKRYQSLHHLLQLGNWEMDLLDNRMHWSLETYQLLGYHPNSFEPKLADYLQIVHPEDREEVKLFFQEAVRHSKPVQIEHRAVISNRVMKYLCLKAQVVSEEKNNKLILLGTLQDITEIKRTTNGNLSPASFKPTQSEEQTKLSYQLRQLTDKLLQLLKKSESGSIVKQKEHLGYAKEIAAHQLDLIYQQINASIITGGDLSARKDILHLPTWKNRIAAMIEAKMLPLKIMPELEWSQHLPDKVLVDEHLLSLLLFNFIQDGFCLSEEKESLRINFQINHLTEKEANLHLTLAAPSHPLSIGRRKKCVAFVEEQLQNKINDFPNSEEETRPHLIALAKILQALQANFTISQTEDIEIAIPLEIYRAENNITKRNIQMLIVAHQTIMQIALKRILQSSLPQLSLDFAENVSAGVQKLSEKNYDLVLVDLQLPDTDPIETVKTFKKYETVVLMAFASEFSQADKISLGSLGVEAFITKPPQREALLQSIRALLQTDYSSTEKQP